MITLGLRYPSQTIIQYSQYILGKWLGRFVGLTYIILFLLIASFATRDYAELYLLLLPETPKTAFIAVSLLIAAYASVQGLEVIARAAEVLVPIIFFSIIIGILLNTPNMDLLQLELALDDGWRPAMMDAIIQLPFIGIAVSWLFLFPSLNIKTDARKTLLLSIAILGLVIFLVSITIVSVLGADAPVVSNYQFFWVFRQINIANFIQRIEPLFLISWSSTSFLVVTLFYYAASASIKQWLGLKNQLPLILPTGAIIFVLSIILFPSYMELRQFFRLDRFGLIALPIEFGIPLLLLVVDYVRAKN
ncbi:Spore germination protein YndE [Pelotomaculum sp. FP]|nr:Spore germination protein YndE [Pelotomaculum sp. FP]